MKKILSQIGVKCKLNKNEMIIHGKGMIDASDKKISIGNLGDHRIAMCGFILSILTHAKTSIKNFETAHSFNQNSHNARYMENKILLDYIVAEQEKRMK